MKGVSSKHTVLKADNYYRSEKYTVCRRVRASFSPEMLQGWGSEGVNGLYSKRVSAELAESLSERNTFFLVVSYKILNVSY